MKLPIIWSLFQNKTDCICVGGETIADLLEMLTQKKADLLNITAEDIAPIAQDLESWVKAHPHSRKKIQNLTIIEALKKHTPDVDSSTFESGAYFIRPLKDQEVLHELRNNEEASQLIKDILTSNGVGSLWDFIDDDAVYYEEETGDVFTAKSYEKELNSRGKKLEDLYYVNENGDIIPFGLVKDSSEMTLIQKSIHDFGVVLVKDCFTNDDTITLDDVEAIKEFIDDEMPETLFPFTDEEKLDLIEAVKEEIKEGNWELPPRNLEYDEDNAEDIDEWFNDEEENLRRKWSDDDWDDREYKKGSNKLSDDDWDDDKWDEDINDDDEDDEDNPKPKKRKW